MWTLIEMNGAPTEDRGVATLDFYEEEARGIGFCNSFFASYEHDGEALKFADIGQTLMACPDMDPEIEYFATLDNVAAGRIEDDTLLLLDADGNEILVYEPAAHAALEGTTWVLTSIPMGRDTVISPVWGAEVNAIVDDGTLMGSAGCNSYSAEIAIDGTDIELGDIIQTDMYCGEPEGVMEQEAAYLQALSQVASYEIVRSRLTLFDADGAVMLTYAAPAE